MINCLDTLATMQILSHYRSSDVRGAGSSPLGGEGLIPLRTLTLKPDNQHTTTLTLSGIPQELNKIIIYAYSYISCDSCPVLYCLYIHQQQIKPKRVACCRQLF
jgi:hypothetical protein